MGAIANTLRGLLLAPLLLSQAAWCEVYRWLDQNGQVQFGDRPPAEAAAEVEAVELALPPADPEAADAYSIQNQLERMEQARAEREAARPEPAPAPAPETAPAPAEVRTYWGPGYYWPPPRPRPPIHPPLPHPPGPGGPHPEPRPPPSGRLHLPSGVARPAAIR